MNPEIQNKLKNISLATNYIASHVFDNLSFKNSLRSISVDIMDISRNVKDISADRIVLDIKSKLSNSLDLIDLGRIDDSVSEMNARVYSQGLMLFMENFNAENILVKYIDKAEIEKDREINRQATEKLTAILGGALETVNLSEVRDIRALAKAKLENKLEIQEEIKERDKVYIQENRQDSELNNLHLEVKSTNKNSPENKAVSESESRIESEAMDVASPDYVFETKEESESVQRRAAILSVLALGGNSVNDIKRKFPKYSPKTLQRDIGELIEEKKIVRIGDKRWAKYYLK